MVIGTRRVLKENNRQVGLALASRRDLNLTLKCKRSKHSPTGHVARQGFIKLTIVLTCFQKILTRCSAARRRWAQVGINHAAPFVSTVRGAPPLAKAGGVFKTY